MEMENIAILWKLKHWFSVYSTYSMLDIEIRCTVAVTVISRKGHYNIYLMHFLGQVIQHLMCTTYKLPI